MPTGTVRRFNGKKVFGFISVESGQDVFVHHSSIESDGFRTLEEGEKVKFEIVQGEKGNKAENIKKV